MNPTLPSIRAAQRILELSRQLPVRIARRAVLVNRVGSNGAAESVDRELAGLRAERLPDVPQDDDVESGGGRRTERVPPAGEQSRIGGGPERRASPDRLRSWCKNKFDQTATL